MNHSSSHLHTVYVCPITLNNTLYDQRAVQWLLDLLSSDPCVASVLYVSKMTHLSSVITQPRDLYTLAYKIGTVDF